MSKHHHQPPKRHSLKELQTRRDQLQTKLRHARQEKDDVSRNVRELSKRIGEIDKEIRTMTSTPSVSEHAVLRHLEHVLGMDIEIIRLEILSPDVMEKIRELGDGRYPVSQNRGIAIVKNNVVVSVVPNGKSAKEIADEQTETEE